MTKVKYLIIGAGPAGLSLAARLNELHENSFLLIEKEDEAGGLCRSKIVDSSPLDIGGGHFLDVKNKAVLKFLFSFMPENEWNLFTRDSRISIHNQEIGHPFEANIWQLNEENQLAYLKSISDAGCNSGEKIPEDFIPWIYWKLGDLIADNYMIPYNTKMFGKNLNNLGTYWLEKLPNVSYEETKRSCEERRPFGTEPGHSMFYYPKKYGYGELWIRLADYISDKLILNATITEFDTKSRRVKLSDGTIIEAEFIINTAPWTDLEAVMDIPESIRLKIKDLCFSSIEVKYYQENYDSEAQWIYIPDINISYHRVLNRRVFCNGSRGYWTETNKDRIGVSDNKFSFMNQFAYPLNTKNKNIIMNGINYYMKSNNILGLGRWGEWQHYNSDVTVQRAINLAEMIVNY